MTAHLTFNAFDAAGNWVSGGTKGLPDSLDWASIQEKTLYFKYMGGLPEGVCYCTVESQGGRMLITDVDADMTHPVDAETFKRKSENVESYISEECRRLGIDRNRKRGNQ